MLRMYIGLQTWVATQRDRRLRLDLSGRGRRPHKGEGNRRPRDGTGKRPSTAEGRGQMIRISWHRAHTDESGQTLVEYTLILMFGAVETIGTTVADFLSEAAAGFAGA